MKTISAIVFGLLAVVTPVLNLSASGVYPLADSGFESGAFSPNSTTPVWADTFGGPVFSQDVAHSGVWSMKFAGADNIRIGQTFTVVPGATYTLSAWGLTPNPVALSQNGQSVLFLIFNSPSQPQAFINSVPYVSSSSPANTWIYMSKTLTAPSDAVSGLLSMGMFTFLSPGATVYLDDVTLTEVPEPSSLVIIGIGSAGLIYFRPRRRR